MNNKSAAQQADATLLSFSSSLDLKDVVLIDVPLCHVRGQLLLRGEQAQAVSRASFTDRPPVNDHVPIRAFNDALMRFKEIKDRIVVFKVHRTLRPVLHIAPNDHADGGHGFP